MQIHTNMACLIKPAYIEAWLIMSHCMYDWLIPDNFNRMTKKHVRNLNVPLEVQWKPVKIGYQIKPIS